MVDQHHIYMTANGRISMAGLVSVLHYASDTVRPGLILQPKTTSNVDYVAECIDKVVRG